MFRRILVALALSVAVLLAQPVLLLALQPLRNASIHSVPVIGWVTSSVVNLLPVIVTVVLLLVIWLAALRIWKRVLLGLPGFRAGLSKDDFASLDKSEKRALRALYANPRKIVTDAGLTKKDASGTEWFPAISGFQLIPSGIAFSIGGVAMIPGSEIERSADALAAAIPGSEGVEVLPSNDVRYARFVLRTRDPLAQVDGLDLGSVERRDAGSLDDFLGMED